MLFDFQTINSNRLFIIFGQLLFFHVLSNVSLYVYAYFNIEYCTNLIQNIQVFHTKSTKNYYIRISNTVFIQHVIACHFNNILSSEWQNNHFLFFSFILSSQDVFFSCIASNFSSIPERDKSITKYYTDIPNLNNIFEGLKFRT